MRGTDGEDASLPATGTCENYHVAVVDSRFSLAVVQCSQRLGQPHRLGRESHQLASVGMTTGAPTIAAAALIASIM